MTRPSIGLALLLATAALAGCGSDQGAGNPDSAISLEQATAPLPGAPPALAGIREQANRVLEGEAPEDFETRLGELKAAGVPVVVNNWASWCGPCRLEFPAFQSQAQKRGGEVAFLGVASNDSIDALDTFLGRLPLPYPSYYDPKFEIAQELGGSAKRLPKTAFYDSSGELVFTQPGVYDSEADLAADIEEYAR